MRRQCQEVASLVHFPLPYSMLAPHNLLNHVFKSHADLYTQTRKVICHSLKHDQRPVPFYCDKHNMLPQLYIIVLTVKLSLAYINVFLFIVGYLWMHWNTVYAKTMAGPTDP